MNILKWLGWALAVLVGLVLVAFGLGYALFDAEFEIAATVADDPNLPRIEAGGMLLHGEAFGDPANPVAIVLHGGPGGDYRNIISLQSLSDRFYVVFYDQRGSGLSPRIGAEQLMLANFVSELDSLVDLFGNGRPVSLIGHSWGAMLATVYLSRHPDKVDQLVLAEPGILTPESASAFMEANFMAPTLELIWLVVMRKFEALHVRGPDDQARADYGMIKIATAEIEGNPADRFFCGGDPSGVKSWRYGQLAQMTLFGEAFDEEGIWRANFVEGIETYPRPVLFMTGECSQIIGAAHQRQHHMSLFQDAELVVIENAGHEMFEDQPEAATAAVRAYLEP